MAIEQIKDGELLVHGKRFKARVFDINGRVVELYKVGALSAALERTTGTLEMWEKAGILPTPLYRMRGSVQGALRCKRWYSKEQIINLRKVWRVLPYGQGQMHLRDAFIKAVKHVFYLKDVVSLEMLEHHGITNHQAGAGVPHDPRTAHDANRTAPRPHGSDHQRQ